MVKNASQPRDAALFAFLPIKLMRRMPRRRRRRGYKCQLQGTNERTRVSGGRMSACLSSERPPLLCVAFRRRRRSSSSHSPPIGEWSLNKGNARKNDSLTAAASSVTKKMNTTTTCVSAVSIRKECNYGNEVAQEPSFHGGETDTSYLLPIRFYHLRQGRGLWNRFSFSTAPICRVSSN